MIFIFVSSIVFVIFILCLKLKYDLNFWNRKNIPFISSDVCKTLVMPFHYPVSTFEHYMILYRKLSGHAYGGCFWHFRPQLLVRDPELIKHILVKDFDYFCNRGSVNVKKNDPITNHVFGAPGDLWRKLRMYLTPTFTPAKMKVMFDTIKEYAQEYQKTIQESARSGLPVDVDHISLCYCTDAFTSTAFGVQMNSTNCENSGFNQIRRIIQKPRFIRDRLRTVSREWLSFLKPIFYVSTLHPEAEKSFTNAVNNIVQYRKQTGHQRNDFLQILINLNERQNEKTEIRNKNGRCNDLEMTGELMMAQCYLFFLAGFQSPATVFGLTLLELALNVDVQKKLQIEIDEHIEKNNNQVTNDMINNMPYLQQVVQETMRKYPVLPILSRICTKPYKLPNSDVIIEEGTEVVIPVVGIHRNEEYYPDPEKYDPERFNKDCMRDRHDFVYLPYGEGPRNCIGYKFGLMSAKLGLVHLLKAYNFETTSETQYPVQFKPGTTVTACKNALVLKCSARSKN